MSNFNSNLSYQEMIKILNKKYNPVKEPYFTPNTWQRNIKINRGQEGLIVHHVKEDSAIKLSDKSWAKKYPFDYQKPENLVYCNTFEHFVLHNKIFYDDKQQKEEYEEKVLPGNIEFILPQLVVIYCGADFQLEYLKKCKEKCLPFKNDFKEELIKMMHFIKNSNNKTASAIRKQCKDFNIRLNSFHNFFNDVYALHKSSKENIEKSLKKQADLKSLKPNTKEYDDFLKQKEKERKQVEKNIEKFCKEIDNNLSKYNKQIK